MVVTCHQMRAAEEAAFARGVSAAQLMDEAARGIADVVRDFFPQHGHLVLYLGKGNNAGDALAAARLLLDVGWKVHVRFSYEPAQFREMPALHWKAVCERVMIARSADEIMNLRGNVVMLDPDVYTPYFKRYLPKENARRGVEGRLVWVVQEVELANAQKALPQSRARRPATRRRPSLRRSDVSDGRVWRLHLRNVPR